MPYTKFNKEKELKKKQKYNIQTRYERKAQGGRTYDFVVFMDDMNPNYRPEQLAELWYKANIIQGAIWVKHDSNERRPHYHICVQWTKPITQDKAWLEFANMLDNKGLQYILADHAKNKDKEDGDKPVPTSDIKNRIIYYMHKNAPEKTPYTTKNMGQIGVLRDYDLNQQVRKLETHRITDPCFQLKTTTKFLIEQTNELDIDKITDLCRTLKGMCHISKEYCGYIVLETKKPRHINAIKNAVAKIEDLHTVYDLSSKENIETQLGEYITFNSNSAKNKAKYNKYFGKEEEEKEVE